ncbi:MAG: FAD-dependent oxidoreductase, partial [Acetobacteraceae bacterium]
MPPPDLYDVLVIGGGQAGIPLGRALAAKGLRVALAERRHLGGSCVNFGCTPTKAAIASARIAHQSRRAAEWGVRVGEVAVDFPAVIARARAIAEHSRHALEAGFAQAPNPVLLRGHARLDGRTDAGFRVRVGDRDAVARTVVLNTGTRTAMPPIEGLAEIGVIHAGNWLDRTTLPASLAIIGSGPIGLEMAQFYRRMGSAVTVIDNAARIAHVEDDDVAGAMQALLEAEGIRFRLGEALRHAEGRGDRVVLHTRQGPTIEASALFVATGRRPNTDDLGLETVGLVPDAHGVVPCDERLATPVAGIWVAGDIRGGPMFTHTSWDDHRILLSQLAGDGARTTRRIVPYAIFTDPELGRVGLTEAEAAREGRGVHIGRFEMAQNGKAAEVGESAGFIKVLVDAESDAILGAAVLA